MTDAKDVRARAIDAIDKALENGCLKARHLLSAIEDADPPIAVVDAGELPAVVARASAAELRIERLLHADCNVCHHMAERAAICSKCGPLCPQCARALEAAAQAEVARLELPQRAVMDALHMLADLKPDEVLYRVSMSGEAVTASEMIERLQTRDPSAEEYMRLVYGAAVNVLSIGQREYSAAETRAKQATAERDAAVAALTRIQAAADSLAGINCPRCHASTLVPLVEGGCVMGERCPACNATWRSM